MTGNGIESLSKFFGGYKAEWLHDSLFDLYTEPKYFPELTTPRPCVLVGGRGTGKTTVLRSLSAEGQLEIIKRVAPTKSASEVFKDFCSLKYIGFYYRANTTRVSAFQGGGLEKREWQKLFQHYINVTFAIKALDFFCWHIESMGSEVLFNQNDLELISKSFSLESVNNESELKANLEASLVKVEAFINNIGIDKHPRLAAPACLETLFEIAGKKTPFIKKTFFLYTSHCKTRKF